MHVFMTCLLTHCSFKQEECAGAYPPRYLPAISCPLLSLLLLLVVTFRDSLLWKWPLLPTRLTKRPSLPLAFSPSPIFCPYWGDGFTFSSCHFHPLTLTTHADRSFPSVRNGMLIPVSISFHFLLNTFMIWEHPKQPHMLFTGKRFISWEKYFWFFRLWESKIFLLSQNLGYQLGSSNLLLLPILTGLNQCIFNMLHTISVC